jgi:hypothetical protein
MNASPEGHEGTSDTESRRRVGVPGSYDGSVAFTRRGDCA